MLDIGFRIRWVPNQEEGVCIMGDDDFIRDLRETITREFAIPAWPTLTI
jgi:hypothetical protein